MSGDDSLARITGPRVKTVASATCESALVWPFSTMSSSSTRVTSSMCRSLSTR